MMPTISQWSLQKIVYPNHMLHFSKSHQGYLFQTCLRKGTHEIPEIKRQAFTVHKDLKQTLQKDKFFHTWWWAGAILSGLIGHPESNTAHLLATSTALSKREGKKKVWCPIISQFPTQKKKNCLGFDSHQMSHQLNIVILLVIADSWKVQTNCRS